MPFPNFEGKHAHDAMFSAQDYLAHFTEHGGNLDFTVPDVIFFTYHHKLHEHLRDTHNATLLMSVWNGGLYHLPGTSVGFVGGFGIGAPAAVAIFEELIALGCKSFLSIGTAGTLQKDIRVGDFLVIDKSIRDEGTSHHYLPQARFAHASPRVVQAITRALGERHMPYRVGASWTTDAPYRETVEEARHYQNEGILCVEMELSALFAVAEARQVDMGAMVTVSDSLAELEWQPSLRDPTYDGALAQLADVALSIGQALRDDAS